MTRTIRGIDSEVELGVQHGLKTRCAVSLDNLFTIPKLLLDRRMTALDADAMNAVWEALHFALDVPF